MPALDRKVGAAAIVHDVPQARDVARVLADQHRRQLFFDAGHRRRIGADAADTGLRLAESNNACVGLNPHKGRVEGGHAAKVRGVLPVLGNGDAQPVRTNAADFHGFRTM